jgi:hypothetical protein
MVDTAARSVSECILRVLAAVRQLPLASRQVATLTLEGFAPAEVAQVLGLTVNAVAVIGDGMVFVNSGYGSCGGMPGNVLLAYSVEGK